MFLPEYSIDQLHFAFRCYVYYRWHTYRRRPIAALKQLTADQLQTAFPEIHVLEITNSEVESAMLVSLQPTDSVSTAASKLKGATSKLIRQLQGIQHPERFLGGGYFAATTGANTSDELDRYLDRQSEHHGYDRHAKPPVWVQSWSLTKDDEKALQSAHSMTLVRWHLVFSTWDRKDVFTRAAGESVSACWRTRARDWRVRLCKVSFVPDHVHVAVWSHPSVVPAELVMRMLNAAQDLMRDEFSDCLIRAGFPRFWKPRAYVGTFGELAKGQIRDYLRRWDTTQRGLPT